eukprot:CAMPEP_0176490524 /NCGR_PEP_ID=MMETSP0200_2-20121128/7920_1 /TAXON_ID=947934 /ORGANISM="Chaetoceros sp., Strain GSL56" /LENGTH=609 /DNA_ID=CAMNT_0017887843 /DNA_START=152 /DNA_END=1977 /DNA_ORIENTATION=-
MSIDEEEETKRMKKAKRKEKKKEDKKKHKKRKRDEESLEEVPPVPSSSSSADNKKDHRHAPSSDEKKRHKKKHKKKKHDKDGTIKDVADLELPSKHIKAAPNTDDVKIVGGRIVSFSAQDINVQQQIPQKENSTTLLLFYQYIEPVLDEESFKDLLHHVETMGEAHGITGRMRVAHEGLNCTLTGSYEDVRSWCKSLRDYKDGKYFGETEFKLTDNLPNGQAFPKLHAFKVEEIVNYGLAGVKAPSIHMTGVHLEPKDYHQKMMEEETVIIDVRNHYEAAIGKFQPPPTGAQYIDPMMRKSTEFPIWLDKPETKEMLRGKQVLMYCTGGVRCERASALLRTKMEMEEDTKALGIKGVYQLQGGIDKYFRDFPEGGWWRGKNYVFDKRFAHAPPVIETLEREVKKEEKGIGKVFVEIPSSAKEKLQALGNCEACKKPWDKYRGKRRCPTCGVPSLICKECHDADANGIRKLDRSIRCDLCVKEGITSKQQIREREEKEMEQYEKKLREIYGFELPKKKKRNAHDVENIPKRHKSAPNPDNITRLFIKNLCAKRVDQKELCELFPGITHVEWIMDKKSGNWYGSVFVEMATAEDAALAVGTYHKNKAYGRV